MKVYWAPLDNAEVNLDLAYYEPNRLSSNIPNDLKNSAYYRCPAFLETVRNTFVLKSPINLKFKINPGQQQYQADNNNLFQTKVRFEDAVNHRIGQFGFNYLIFSEKPLTFTQIHPYLHHNSFTSNGNSLLGEFDCGRWLRPLQSAFVLDSSKQIYEYDIKRGDAYSYIKFNTDKKIEMVRFEVTPVIENIAGSCLQMKQAGTGRPFSLDKCYNQFIIHRRRQVILSEIKKQGKL